MAVAQCNQLFISEYIVGAGNDKAYEIYNPTNQAIDLAPYFLQRWSNGDTDPGNGGTTNLMGTIEAYGTWVVANGQTLDIDLGGFVSPAADPALQALADQLDNPYPAPTFMNGNDALVLVMGTTICDIFGKPGEDPGDAWTAPDGTNITDSQTMIRKPEITSGVTQPPVNFQPLAQYDTLGFGVWTNLGMHDCACNPVSTVNQRQSLDVKVFPNPTFNSDVVTIQANYLISSIEVFDITGRRTEASYKISEANTATLDINNFKNGAYIVNVLMENNVGFSTRIIKN